MRGQVHDDGRLREELGRPADAFICSTYCYSKCLFDIDCDMSNGETCMGNVCRIECSEDSDCQWSQVQTLKQCNLTTKKCFWPCKGTPNPGNCVRQMACIGRRAPTASNQ